MTGSNSLWLLQKRFAFEAAHKLPSHDGKCARLHGHSWVGYVGVAGSRLQTEGAKAGMLIDYSEIKAAFKPLLNMYLDHHYLNDTLNLENPTSELVAKFIYDHLARTIPNLQFVRIDETCTSRCTYSRVAVEPSFIGDDGAVGQADDDRSNDAGDPGAGFALLA
jgi:6-pyruvoyltetrahydropterin/6-carboxytetrahydropterin synthase